MTRWTAALLFTALMAAAPAAAQGRGGNAQPIDSLRLDIHGDFTWYRAFGVGARLDIPIVPRGFLREGGAIQDDFVISPGVDVFFWNSYRYSWACGPGGRDVCTSGGFDDTFAALLVAAQWNLYYKDISFFPEAGLAVILGHAYYWQDRYYNSFIWPFLGAGFRWHFSPGAALLIRASWPAGLQIGVTINL